MFKTDSFEQELVEGMSKKLVSNQIENLYSFEKISKAADYLNSAAEILDDTGMTAEAELITRLLEKIAKSNSGSKKKLKNDSAARLKAMERTGIPFLKSDNNYLDLNSEVEDFEEEYQEEPHSDLGYFLKNSPFNDDNVDLNFDYPVPFGSDSGHPTDNGDVDEMDLFNHLD